MSTFQYGANYKIVGKCSPEQLSYAGAWKQRKGGFADLERHISNGHPWMPALLNGNAKRWQSNANHAEVLALDIDGGWAIQDAIDHPFVAAHCGLGVESASSKPEMEKFRLVFRASDPIKGWELVRICNRYLAHVVGHADPACKDASRFFFGAKGRAAFLLNESAALPDDFAEQAIAWHEASEAEERIRVEDARKRWEQWREENPESGNLVAEALRFISPYTPGEGRYSDLIAMIGGILSEMGSDGAGLLREWDGGRGQWGTGGFDRILSSVERSHGGRKATLGTLFYFAKKEGFKFPQRKLSATAKGSASKERAKAQRKVAKQDRLDEFLSLLGLSSDLEERQQQLFERLVYQGDRKPGSFQYGEIQVPLRGRRLIILDGPKGSCKTSNGIKTVIDWAIKQDLAVNVGVPSRLLSSQAAEVLEIASHVDSNWRESKLYAACPESSHHWLDRPVPEITILDEVNETILRGIDSLGNKSDQNFRGLSACLSGSRVVVIANDQVKKSAVRAVMQLGGFSPDEVDYYGKGWSKNPSVTVNLYFDRDPLSIVERDSPGLPETKPSWWGFLEEMDQSMGEGRVIVPAGSESFIRALSRISSTTVIDGKHTPDAVRKEFAQNPVEFCKKPNSRTHLAFSQVANSGVSINEALFKAQFNYVTGFETSSAALQRGERYRPVLDGKAEQHVYISHVGNGIPEDLSIFDEATVAERWAKSRQDGSVNTKRLLELSERAKLIAPMLVEQEVERVFKLDLMRYEWEHLRGYSVVAGTELLEKPSFAELIQAEKINIEEQKARIQSKVRLRGESLSTEEEDALGVLSRYRARRAKQESVLGSDSELLNKRQWQLVYDIATDPILNCESFKLQALLRIEHEFPGLLSELGDCFVRSRIAATDLPRDRWNKTLKALNPIGYNVLRLANALSACPGIQGIISGELSQWGKENPIIQQAEIYLKEHAEEITTFTTKLCGRRRGINFPESVGAVGTFHRALKAIGIEAKALQHSGTDGDRARVYGVAAYAEGAIRAAEKLEKLKSPSLSAATSLEREVYRYELATATYDAISKQLRKLLDPHISARTVFGSNRSNCQTLYVQDLIEQNWGDTKPAIVERLEQLGRNPCGAIALGQIPATESSGKRDTQGDATQVLQTSVLDLPPGGLGEMCEREQGVTRPDRPIRVGDVVVNDVSNACRGKQLKVVAVNDGVATLEPVDGSQLITKTHPVGNLKLIVQSKEQAA